MAYRLDASNQITDITKSDSTIYDPPLRKILVGGTGDVVVKDLQGTSHTFASVPAFTTLDGPFQMIMSTNTTATLIKGYPAMPA